MSKGLSVLSCSQEFFHPVHFIKESSCKDSLIILFDLSAGETVFSIEDRNKICASGEISNKVLSFNNSLTLSIKPALNKPNKRLWLIIDKSWLIEKTRYISQQASEQVQKILRFDNLFCEHDLTLSEIKAAKKILDHPFDNTNETATFFHINAFTNELISSYLKERLNIEKSYNFDVKMSELAKIIEIRKYVTENILQKTQICLKTLCHRFHITESTFQRNFKKYFDCNFIEFYNEVRLKKAYELLRYKDTVSVNEIARSLGYKNVPYFSKRFKSMFNVYPREVRKYA
ncbi:helix-turn-helix domain-containing protein [Pinibacter soli]|uniref:helix-turn-helix domain-containing protein n=1 Tax=Pinibacter soli TaxID=3044211 RepID=UPI00249B1D18|nr:helix-turn-helix domain-containing protein [Pinibacter soli]